MTGSRGSTRALTAFLASARRSYPYPCPAAAAAAAAAVAGTRSRGTKGEVRGRAEVL